MVYNEGDKVLFALSDGTRKEGYIKFAFRRDLGVVITVQTETDLFVPPEVKILEKINERKNSTV